MRVTGRTEVETDVILVAVGRRPLTEGIGLENIPGVELERGYVKVDEYMRTGVEHLYAIGDMVPGFQLAHVASHEAVVAVEKIAGHDPEPVRMDLMPRVTFCRPQIASVGIGEAAGAREQGREVKVGSVPVPRPGQGDDRRRGRRLRQDDGRCARLASCSARTSSVPHAGDLLAEPTLARLVEGTIGEIADVRCTPTRRSPRCSPRPPGGRRRSDPRLRGEAR